MQCVKNVTANKIYGLVLAAGMSTRMESFKPLLPLRGRTVIENTVDSILNGGASKVIVVVGYRGNELEEKLKATYGRKVHIVWNTEFSNTDMMHSIQLGCRGLTGCDAFFLLPGDMPVVKQSTFEKMLEAWKSNKYDILFPMLDGHRKHPPLISSNIIPDIINFTGDGGMRQFFKQYENVTGGIAVDDMGVWVDLDTPTDYSSCVKNLMEAKENQSII